MRPGADSREVGGGWVSATLAKAWRSLYALRMKVRFIVAGIIAVALTAAAAATAVVWYRPAFPPASSELIQVTPEKRAALNHLRAEPKFGPHNFPPLGYTGAATPRDKDVATAAVDDMIDPVLAHRNGAVAAKDVTRLIAKAMRRVDLLDTEDRDRAGDYMLEVWFILGFKGATGQFAHGSAFPRWPGYAEPLPPGWKSPTEPRRIG